MYRVNRLWPFALRPKHWNMLVSPCWDHGYWLMGYDIFGCEGAGWGQRGLSNAGLTP